MKTNFSKTILMTVLTASFVALSQGSVARTITSSGSNQETVRTSESNVVSTVSAEYPAMQNIEC
ncbi:MAG: hypothetical protein ACRC3B_18345, partial [Bacteroidia bacterium]